MDLYWQSIFDSFPLDQLFGIFACLLARLLPIFSLVPFFGGKSAPIPLRLGLALTIAILFLPSINVDLQGSISCMDRLFPITLFKEGLLGIIIGFLAAMPFYLVQSSGIFIDFMRGASSMMSSDALLQTQASTIGILYNKMALVLFFFLDGPQYFLNSFLTTYQLFPIGGFSISEIALLISFQKASSLMALFMALALQIAAPALVGCLIAEVFLGIANRLAPQVQIAFLGVSLKSFLGIVLLLLSWKLTLEVTGKEITLWIHQTFHPTS